MKEDLSFAVYLSFNGNCRQAFNYYQSCFGGELTMQTLADSPHGRKMSREMQNVVVSATLRNNYFKLMGTDLMEEDHLATGNNISILIECDSFTERIKLITKLTERNFCAMGNTNPMINLKDKFSINWILRVC